MKLVRAFSVSVILALAASGAWAGHGGSGGTKGGGDEDGLVLLGLLETTVREFKASRPRGIDLKALGKLVPRVAIVPVDRQLSLVVGGVVTHPVAINDRATMHIYLDRARWGLLPVEIRKAALLHELLSLAEVESTGRYQYSSPYLARLGYLCPNGDLCTGLASMPDPRGWDRLEELLPFVPGSYVRRSVQGACGGDHALVTLDPETRVFSLLRRDPWVPARGASDAFRLLRIISMWGVPEAPMDAYLRGGEIRRLGGEALRRLGEPSWEQEIVVRFREERGRLLLDTLVSGNEGTGPACTYEKVSEMELAGRVLQDAIFARKLLRAAKARLLGLDDPGVGAFCASAAAGGASCGLDPAAERARLGGALDAALGRVELERAGLERYVAECSGVGFGCDDEAFVPFAVTAAVARRARDESCGDEACLSVRATAAALSLTAGRP